SGPVEKSRLSGRFHAALSQARSVLGVRWSEVQILSPRPSPSVISECGAPRPPPRCLTPRRARCRRLNAVTEQDVRPPPFRPAKYAESRLASRMRIELPPRKF